jgi:hypothetical protein
MGFPSKTPKAPKKVGQQMGPQPTTTASRGNSSKPSGGPMHTPPPLRKAKAFKASK